MNYTTIYTLGDSKIVIEFFRTKLLTYKARYRKEGKLPGVNCVFFMTCLHRPDCEAPLPLHVPPVPGLAGHIEDDGAGVLAKVADFPLLLSQTEDVLRVENGLST